MLLFFALFKINCNGLIRICFFSYRQIFSFWIYFWQFSQFSFHILNHMFSLKKSQWYIIILVLNEQPNVTFYHFYLSNYFWRNWKVFILLVRLLGLTHSSLFQFNWDLKSFHHLLSSYIFLKISSSLSYDFLLSVDLLNGGSPLALFPHTIHHQYL